MNGIIVVDPALRGASPVISRRAFKQSLTHHGLRAQVEDFVSRADQDTKDWYADATQFERYHPMLIAAIRLLGISDEQADAVWAYANTIAS